MSAGRPIALLGLLGWLAVAPALAVQSDEVLPNPALESRARALSAELRCLVCQNQSIDDSAAPLARDLRLIVRERLVAGDSDAGVKTYLVSRYGDFILLKPPFDRQTLLLWIMPILVLALGSGAMLRARRAGRRRTMVVAALDAEEEARLAVLTRGPHAG